MARIELSSKQILEFVIVGIKNGNHITNHKQRGGGLLPLSDVTKTVIQPVKIIEI